MKSRPILSIFLLSLAASFMFFIFEPISLFVNNPDDFWFSVSAAMPILLGAFVGCMVVFFLILFLFELFCKKVIKKPKVFEYALAILTAIFLITYIQGNFLSAFLPGLNGEPFVWQDYPIESVVSILLWVIVFILLAFAIKKLSIQKIVSYIPIAIGAVLVMLTVGLVSTVVSHLDAFAMKDEAARVATYKNYNVASNHQNFYILLVDMVDSQSFDEAMRDNPDYQSTFQDFTYFPDAISYFPFTQNSVPQILTGIPNQNEMPYSQYLNEAYGEGSTLFKDAINKGYDLNLYDNSIKIKSGVTEKFDNFVPTTNIDPLGLIKQILRFDLYKYLPYPLKPFAKIESSDFSASKIAILDENNEIYEWNDLKNYNLYKNKDIELSDNKMFSFIHLEGAHMPFSLNGDMQQINANEGTYEQKEGATFTTIKAFLDRLRNAGVYDNSVVIVLSDHGYDPEEHDDVKLSVMSRMNPLLYIKGFDETHSEMIRSDKPISFADLNSAYNQLLQGQPSTELFDEISYPRTRTFLLYDDWLNSEIMEEYQTDGAAWDVSKMEPTGNVYKLEE